MQAVLSRKRDQVHSMDLNIQFQDTELGLFQRQVSDRLHDLASVDSSDLLSIQWIQKLLHAFLSCLEDFKLIVSNTKPPMDKHLSDFLDRSVKALDVCNAIRDGIEQIRIWQKQLEIVLCALDFNNNNNNVNQRSMGEGQFRRAKKALIDLAIGLLDDKGAVTAKRNRSFGRNDEKKEQKSFSQFRSLSWSVSRTWSAAKQLQAIGNNLIAPKSSEILSSNGMSVAVFTMNNVLLFVMWALVAAIPCQDRGLQTQFNVPRQFVWAVPIISLHERILEESKKRDRRNVCGLLKEIQEIEKCARVMNALTNSVSFPLSEEKEEEVKLRVEEVRVLYEAIKDGLDPLERRVREVFHRIVRCRTEGLDSVGKANGHS